jgi:hypothetical protein
MINSVSKSITSGTCIHPINADGTSVQYYNSNQQLTHVSYALLILSKNIKGSSATSVWSGVVSATPYGWSWGGRATQFPLARGFGHSQMTKRG